MQTSKVEMSTALSSLAGSGVGASAIPAPSAGPKKRGAKLVQPRPSIPGTFPDRTVLANFHSTSQRDLTVISEFRCVCNISTGDRFKFIINDSPDQNLVFPASIRNPVTAKRSPTSPLEDIYKIEEVWITVEDQDQPLLADLNSFTDKTVDCTTRFLSGSIGTAYNNNTTALYNVTFRRVAVSPMFVGTFATAPARQANSRTLCTTTIKTRFISSPSVPFPTAVYLFMMREDPESGKWVNYVPTVWEHQTPLITGPVQHKRDLITKQCVRGTAAYGPVTSDGYVEYTVQNLPLDSKFSCFISDVSNLPDLISLVKDGDTTSDYFLEQAIRAPQPQVPCIFRTPLSLDSDENVVVNAFSCVDGLLTALKTWDTMPECHFKVILGDNYYQDSSDTYDDFMKHYESLPRNVYWKNMESTGGCVHMMQDHEVGDNWNSVIVTTEGNAAQFRLTPEEVTLYNLINTPANAKYIIFKRMANDGLKTVVPNSKIHDALAAFHHALPTMPPDADHRTGNWSERWGRLHAIFANSEPVINEDGSVEYWKRRARVTENPDGSQVIDYVPETPGGEPINQFIPRPAMEHIKSAILTDRNFNKRDEAVATFIFFPGNVSLNYTPQQRQMFEAKFVSLALEADPTGVNVEQKAKSIFDKLWVQRRADKSDLAKSPDILELIQWFKEENIKNVFFITGDPHNSTGNYLDRDNVIAELCLSSVGNYRSNCVTAAFAGKPENTNALFNVSDSNWGNITLDVKGHEVVTRVVGEAGVIAEVTFPLAR